jgi:hypothetical protein
MICECTEVSHTQYYTHRGSSYGGQLFACLNLDMYMRADGL